MSTTLQSSTESDFDFIIGDWRVSHRRLRDRLVACTDWQEFEGSSSTRKILGGRGNVEDNLLHLPEGPYCAAAFRSLDIASGQWAIWWLDGRSPHHLDTPVVGRFSDGQGRFYAEDTLAGRPIRVRFLWLPRDVHAARWEQAFSADAGQTWETNWTMDFERIQP